MINHINTHVFSDSKFLVLGPVPLWDGGDEGEVMQGFSSTLAQPYYACKGAHWKELPLCLWKFHFTSMLLCSLPCWFNRQLSCQALLLICSILIELPCTKLNEHIIGGDTPCL